MVAKSLVVTADDLLAGGGADGFVVHDGVARHVHTHIRGRFVYAFVPCDAREDVAHDGEGLHVPVVVDGGDAVGLQMERVDHVHVREVGSGRLVGQVHRMLQRQIPDGERLKLGIARHTALADFVIHLREAGGQLAGAGAGGRHHHERPGGFDVGVRAVAFVAADIGDVRGIALDGAVDVVFHAAHRQLFGEAVGCRLAGVLRDDHAVHADAHVRDVVDETQHLHIIADAEVRAHFCLFNVSRRDGEDDLGLFAHLVQQANLAVGVEPRQHPGRVVIIKKLAAELQVQLAAKLSNALPDMLRLHLQIFIVVKRLVNHDSRLFQVKINHATL